MPAQATTARAGLVIHCAGPLEKDALAGILRSAANARDALVPAAIAHLAQRQVGRLAYARL